MLCYLMLIWAPFTKAHEALWDLSSAYFYSHITKSTHTQPIIRANADNGSPGMPGPCTPQTLYTFHLLGTPLLSLSARLASLPRLSSKATFFSLILLFSYVQQEPRVTSCVFLTTWELVHSHGRNSEHFLSTSLGALHVIAHSDLHNHYPLHFTDEETERPRNMSD